MSDPGLIKIAPACPTEQHLLLFGAIIQWFARYELLMQQIMARISGADVTSIKLLTAGLDFAGKSQAMFNLIGHRAMPEDQAEGIRNYMQVVRTYSLLHDDIVHSVWVEGEPPNSIWPVWLNKGPRTAIKALHGVPTDEKVFVEDYDDRVAYTVDDLQQITKTIADNHAAFVDYVVGIGLATRNPGNAASS